MNPKNENFADVYAAQFGRQLSGSEISAWTNEIREAFEGKTRPWPGEASKALRSLAATWPTDDGKGGRNPYPPTCRDLISAMKAARRKAVTDIGAHVVLSPVISTAPDGSSYLRTASHAENTGDWQRELRDADAGSRWSIICRPADNDQCAERERFCTQYGLRFERFKAPTRYALAETGAI